MAVDRWRVPGEWEPQDTVILAWDGTEAIAGMPSAPVQVAEVEALLGRVAVMIVAASPAKLDHARTTLGDAGVAREEITFGLLPELDSNIYPRDIGPECVITAQGEVEFVDINCTAYGFTTPESPVSRLMEQVDRELARRLGIPEHNWTRLCSEGGAREFNGAGVMMAIERTELQRNPGLSLDEIEAELTRIFSLDKVIWLCQPSFEDEHMLLGPIPAADDALTAYRSASANGHIDEICRFVAPDTILLAEVTEQEASQSLLHSINRARMEENLAVVESATDQDGNPFRIVRMPMPDPRFITMTPDDEWNERLAQFREMTGIPGMLDGSLWPTGDVTLLPAMSYCNFLVTNDVVLGQRYWEPEMDERYRDKDDQAAAVLAELFSDREIVMIGTTALNVHGGGIHCNTRNIPRPRSG